MGTKIKRGDEVKFHDQTVSIERKIYVLLNKPKDTVTTSDDPQARRTVMDSSASRREQTPALARNLFRRIGSFGSTNCSLYSICFFLLYLALGHNRPNDGLDGYSCLCCRIRQVFHHPN